MKQREDESYLLDTSAILALLYGEPGADIVETVLNEAKRNRAEAFISFISRMEMLYVVWKDHGRERAVESLHYLDFLPLKVIESNEEILLKAAELKATMPISMADSWVASSAIRLNAVLVHKDPEFEALSAVVRMKKLPYK
jgi:predicted nucleic acid-binding protein